MVITVGGGVVTTGISVTVDDDVSVDVSVEVSEAETESDDDVGVGVGVGIEGVDEADDEIELEEHEVPKRVVNAVTGTLIVNIAGTTTVVAAPE